MIFFKPEIDNLCSVFCHSAFPWSLALRLLQLCIISLNHNLIAVPFSPCSLFKQLDSGRTDTLGCRSHAEE